MSRVSRAGELSPAFDDDCSWMALLVKGKGSRYISSLLVDMSCLRREDRPKRRNGDLLRAEPWNRRRAGLQ